mgnify:CR=1 FL=1
MIPSIVGRELEERFACLLKTQFCVREDGGFRHLWEDFFSRGEKLIKGPYLELPLPYRKSTDAAALTRFSPAIEKLPFPPYKHQVRAFDRIGAFKSTLVATGTGSGKTECFSLPILAHCAKYAGENGIRAILIYPMNALATDQAKRLAELICKNAGLKGVRVGLYIGEGKSRRGGARASRPVIVIPEAPTSALPDWTALMMESNCISSILSSMPRISHTACIISISNPVISPLS